MNRFMFMTYVWRSWHDGILAYGDNTGHMISLVSPEGRNRFCERFFGGVWAARTLPWECKDQCQVFGCSPDQYHFHELCGPTGYRERTNRVPDVEVGYLFHFMVYAGITRSDSLR